MSTVLHSFAGYVLGSTFPCVPFSYLDLFWQLLTSLPLSPWISRIFRLPLEMFNEETSHREKSINSGSQFAFTANLYDSSSTQVASCTTSENGCVHENHEMIHYSYGLIESNTPYPSISSDQNRAERTVSWGPKRHCTRFQGPHRGPSTDMHQSQSRWEKWLCQLPFYALLIFWLPFLLILLFPDLLGLSYQLDGVDGFCPKPFLCSTSIGVHTL